ncbi:MAG TPA: hypothetical protein VJT77_05215 [Burkholderiales bacterium]|nr:hypothetical protein [Burkholderiales bacterium]
MTPLSRNEVADHLKDLYSQTPVGGDIWVKPDDTTSLRKFQIVAAAAQDLERLGRIQIIEMREGAEGELRLINGIRIRRLK